mmetsp:Transcript_70033/g.210385  ORF Transcript_70033/g.210385 Transcript_70033/m.210385 type:complete len:211 (+) Transcript_70033:608-1240(+)
MSQLLLLCLVDDGVKAVNGPRAAGAGSPLGAAAACSARRAAVGGGAGGGERAVVATAARVGSGAATSCATAASSLVAAKRLLSSRRSGGWRGSGGCGARRSSLRARWRCCWRGLGGPPPLRIAQHLLSHLRHRRGQRHRLGRVALALRSALCLFARSCIAVTLAGTLALVATLWHCNVSDRTQPLHAGLVGAAHSDRAHPRRTAFPRDPA